MFDTAHVESCTAGDDVIGLQSLGHVPAHPGVGSSRAQLLLLTGEYISIVLTSSVTRLGLGGPFLHPPIHSFSFEYLLLTKSL